MTPRQKKSCGWLVLMNLNSNLANRLLHFLLAEGMQISSFSVSAAPAGQPQSRGALINLGQGEFLIAARPEMFVRVELRADNLAATHALK